jgi:hypothetical protein
MSGTLTAATMLKIDRVSTWVDIYSAQVRMNLSVADFAITFSTLNDLGPGAFSVSDLAVVRLSPSTAKILQVYLNAAIVAYETAVGEIKIPDPSVEVANQWKDLIVQNLKAQISGVMASS